MPPQLARAWRALDATGRESLLAFAEFLVARRAAEYPGEDGAARQPTEPALEPAPAGESVIAALKRLRRGYPMLDAADLLNEASLLLSAHLTQGRAAVEVIADLERLFDRHYHHWRRERAPGGPESA